MPWGGGGGGGGGSGEGGGTLGGGGESGASRGAASSTGFQSLGPGSASGHVTASMSDLPEFCSSSACTVRQLCTGAVSPETSCSQTGVQPTLELSAEPKSLCMASCMFQL
eukprot:scaffold108646_cov60-Phaeocystis_antarctica.AAC.1